MKARVSKEEAAPGDDSEGDRDDEGLAGASVGRHRAAEIRRHEDAAENRRSRNRIEHYAEELDDPDELLVRSSAVVRVV